jgi:hypothetical protein
MHYSAVLSTRFFGLDGRGGQGRAKADQQNGHSDLFHISSIGKT